MYERTRFDAVCRDGFKGIAAKRRRDPYKSGERAWVKIKNPGLLAASA
jgi:ATP-dependent DNA ligase